MTACVIASLRHRAAPRGTRLPVVIELRQRFPPSQKSSWEFAPAFGPDSIPLVKSERTGVAGNDPQEWKRRSCWNEQRQLYVKPSAVFASIRDGGRFTKKGRGSIQPNISATLQIEEPVVLIDRIFVCQIGESTEERPMCGRPR